jgi:hypothetical protein
MATASCQASAKMRAHLLVEHWFFIGLTLAMLATSAAGFLPSLLHAAGRRARISPLAAAHGILLLAWLCIFLVQSRLGATENVGLHQRLGVAAGIVLALMIPLAYATTIAMARRGFDLSGDLFRDLVPAHRIAPAVFGSDARVDGSRL